MQLCSYELERDKRNKERRNERHKSKEHSGEKKRKKKEKNDKKGIKWRGDAITDGRHFCASFSHECARGQMEREIDWLILLLNMCIYHI